MVMLDVSIDSYYTMLQHTQAREVLIFTNNIKYFVKMIELGHLKVLYLTIKVI